MPRGRPLIVLNSTRKQRRGQLVYFRAIFAWVSQENRGWLKSTQCFGSCAGEFCSGFFVFCCAVVSAVDVAGPAAVSSATAGSAAGASGPEQDSPTVSERAEEPAVVRSDAPGECASPIYCAGPKIIDVGPSGPALYDAMRPVSRTGAAVLSAQARPRDLLLETLALRHQLSVLARSNPRFRPADRLFWLFLRWFWPRWREALVLIHPATVDRWRREGVLLCWRRRSRRPGRPRIDPTCRDLIRRIAAENCLWGAPRIHGELLKLGTRCCSRRRTIRTSLSTPLACRGTKFHRSMRRAPSSTGQPLFRGVRSGPRCST